MMNVLIVLGVAFGIVYIWLLLEIAKDAFAKYDDRTGVLIQRRSWYVTELLRDSDYISHRAHRKMNQLSTSIHRVNKDIPVRTREGVQWITPKQVMVSL